MNNKLILYCLFILIIFSTLNTTNIISNSTNINYSLLISTIFIVLTFILIDLSTDTFESNNNDYTKDQTLDYIYYKLRD